MMKQFFTFTALLILNTIYSQVWLGGTTSTANIYRTGNVGIGISSAPSYNLVVNHPTSGNGVRVIIGGTTQLTSGTSSGQSLLEIQNNNDGNGSFLQMFSGSTSNKVGLFFTCSSTYGVSITSGATGGTPPY